MSTPTQEEVAKLYVATFNRAPDEAGLNYWVNDSGLDLAGIAQSFFDQSETQALYPEDTSTVDFVTLVYHNLFNRDPDTAGLNYWVNELDNQITSKSLFIQTVIDGAQDSADGLDRTILQNKTDVGLYFAEQGLDDVMAAKELMQGLSDQASSVSSAKVAIDAIEPVAYAFTETFLAQQTLYDVQFSGSTNDNYSNAEIKSILSFDNGVLSLSSPDSDAPSSETSYHIFDSGILELDFNGSPEYINGLQNNTDLNALAIAWDNNGYLDILQNSIDGFASDDNGVYEYLFYDQESANGFIADYGPAVFELF